MKLISRLRDECYCAFCRSPRRIYVKKHVDLTNVVGVGVLAFAFSSLVWSELDPRGMLLFCFLLMAGEIFIYLRWRSAIVCRLCGFDPVLYKRSPLRASQGVNQFFHEAGKSPEFFLTKSPLVELHRRLRENERQRERVSLLEKHLEEALAQRKAGASVPSIGSPSSAPTVSTR